MKQRADCLEAMRWTLKMVGFVLAAAWAMIGEHRAFSMLAYVSKRKRLVSTFFCSSTIQPAARQMHHHIGTGRKCA
jgi:hypothetical protein